MRVVGIYACVLVAIVLSACGKTETSSAPSDNQPAAKLPEIEKPMLSAPDFGESKSVSRDAEGIGSTPELAVMAALQSAVAQVGGVRVASQMQSIRSSLSARHNSSDAASISSEAFVQQIVSGTHGAVVDYEILSTEGIDKIDEEVIERLRASDNGYSYSASGSAKSKFSAKIESAESSAASGGSEASFESNSSYEEKGAVNANRGSSTFSSDSAYKKMRSYWKVRLRAQIAQYQAPDEQGRPKIVVAAPRSVETSFRVGDGQIPASDVARAVRGRLSDILTQTKRFIVVDREFDAEMQAEIDQINSGNVRVKDGARIGQQFAADLLLIPSIERFEYPKHVRKLRMSDRELVSYSGGGRITLRLLNATTGEVVMSESFEHTLASAHPSTMPRVIDGTSMAAQMMEQLSGQIGSAIVAEIFPISVVTMTDNQVVLSQGGESVQVGQRWEATFLGDELTDPQTGRSLGRSESPFGVIRIDRVSTRTSYGTLEEGGLVDGQSFKPGAIELRKTIVDARQPGSAPSRVRSGDEATPKALKPREERDPMATQREKATPDNSKATASDDKW